MKNERDSSLVCAHEKSLGSLSGGDIEDNTEVVISDIQIPHPLGPSIEDRPVTFELNDNGTKRKGKKLTSIRSNDISDKVKTNNVLELDKRYCRGLHNHSNDLGLVKRIKRRTEIQYDTTADADANARHLYDEEEIILTEINIVWSHNGKDEVTGKITITNKKLYIKSKEHDKQVTITVLFCEILYNQEVRSSTCRDGEMLETYHVFLRIKDHHVRLKFETVQQSYQVYKMIRSIICSDTQSKPLQSIAGSRSGKPPKRLAIKQPPISQSKRKTDDDNPPPPKRRRSSGMQFLRKKIEHEWLLKDQSKKMYSGLVTAVLKKSDGDADAVYEVKYDGDDDAYELTHQELLEDYTESSLKLI